MCSIAPCGVNWEQEYMSFKGKHCLKQLAQWPHFCWWHVHKTEFTLTGRGRVVSCTQTNSAALLLELQSCETCRWHRNMTLQCLWERATHYFKWQWLCQQWNRRNQKCCSTGDNVAFVHTTSAILEGTAPLLNCTALFWEALRQCSFHWSIQVITVMQVMASSLFQCSILSHWLFHITPCRQ